MEMSDSPLADFKAALAALGIESKNITAADGRPDIAIDREGLNKLIAAGLLPEDPTDLPAWGELIKKRRAVGHGTPDAG